MLATNRVSSSWLRVLFSIICIAGGCLSIAKAYSADTVFRGEIKKVVDGDTVHFSDQDSDSQNPVMKIRMVGMDTPETHLQTDHGMVSQGYWGDAAARYLNSLIPAGTKVVLKSQGVDKYHRVLGRLFYHDKDVNLRMVQSGWGIPYIICDGSRCNEKFLERENVAEYFDACDKARAAGRGVFNPQRLLREMPFEFRMRMTNRKPERLVGDFDTKLLYAPADYPKVDVCRRVFFPNEEEALRAGFHY